MGAYFPKQSVTGIEGATNVYAFRNAARNEDQIRHFCSKCGTTLYWYSSSLPELVGVAGGCFADVALGEPSITASHSKKLPWVTVPSTWRLWPE
jgi:hypothetical protein